MDALSTLVANLAEPLAACQDVAEKVFACLRDLCIGGGALPPTLRIRVVRSVVGPLLSELPELQLSAAVEVLASPLRSATAPSLVPEGVTAAERATAAQLLFYILAAPQVKRHDLALEWLSAHWQWLEAALTGQDTSETTIDAACHMLTAILSSAKRSPSALEPVRRAIPLLAGVASRRGSAAALSALGALARIFRGGGEDEAVLQLFASSILQVAGQLLASERLERLPMDLLCALLELFTIALAPRLERLGSLLILQTDAMAAVVRPVAALFPICTSPRLVCWGLLFFERLPYWRGTEAPEVGKLSAARLLTLCCQSWQAHVVFCLLRAQSFRTGKFVNHWPSYCCRS